MYDNIIMADDLPGKSPDHRFTDDKLCESSEQEKLKMLLGLVREAQGYLKDKLHCRNWNKRAAEIVKVVEGE